MEESKAPTFTTEPADLQNGNTSIPTAPETSPRTETGEEDEYVTGFKLAAVIGSITLVVFLLLLDMTIVATAIPHITTQFHSLVSRPIHREAFRAGALFHPLVPRRPSLRFCYGIVSLDAVDWDFCVHTL